MRVAVVGIGAIGGYAAAQLSLAGHDVVLCAKRPFDRLIVTSGDRVTTVENRATCDPMDVDPVDWVMLATKVHQSAGAQPWLERLCGVDTRAVVTLQNGIEVPPVVTMSASPTPVVPSIVLFGAELTAPGTVVHHGASRLVVPATWFDAVRNLFDGSDLVVAGADDFLAEAWRKLILNVMSGPICALSRRRLDVFHEPLIAEIALRIGRECVSVARAAGVELSTRLPEDLLSVLQSQPPRMGGSMLYDVLDGRATEHDAITGAVLRTAERTAVAAPSVVAFHALLDALGPRPIEI